MHTANGTNTEQEGKHRQICLHMITHKLTPTASYTRAWIDSRHTQADPHTQPPMCGTAVQHILNSTPHLGVAVDLHTGFCVDVLRADDLTVPLQRLQLEELGRWQQLHTPEKRSYSLVASICAALTPDLWSQRHRSGSRLGKVLHVVGHCITASHKLWQIEYSSSHIRYLHWCIHISLGITAS